MSGLTGYDLVRCPKCGQKRYDPGIGCERRKCAHVKPEDQLPASSPERSQQ